MSALTLISQQYSNNTSVAKPLSQIESGERNSGKELQPFGSDGLTFADVIDIINPLQHIPIVGTIYRKITGDTIDPAARIAGGTLFGGPIGAALAVVEMTFTEINKSTKSTISPADLEQDPVNTELIAAAQSVPKQAGITASVSDELQDGPVQKNTTATLRGGWIVNAAYQGKSSVLFEWAKNPASEHIYTAEKKTNVVVHKPGSPGGWIVNAAYVDRAKTSHKIII